ncbi:MAG: Uma2 family endonuclease, partial [Thermoanaerobaculia bacterium]|nr:Uma2 family endonuclease [Thermoanaerobaculia bacterium]
TLTTGQLLTAPGVLRNPVPVEALYDRRAAHEVALRNLLQREGYEDLEAVRTESREEGREEGARLSMVEGILTVLESRGLHVEETVRARLHACQDLDQLRRWLTRAAVTDAVEGLFTAG